MPADRIERHDYLRDKLIAITVRGECMEPTFYEGDLVVNAAETQPVAGVERGRADNRRSEGNV